MLIISAVIALLGAFTQGVRQPAAADGLFRLTVLDVGQGDALLLDTPHGEHVLVDAGPSGDALGVIGRYLVRPTKLRLLVASHNHADHIGGLPAVLSEYGAEEVWISGAVHTTDVYLRWLQAIQASGAPTKAVKAGETTLADFISAESGMSRSPGHCMTMGTASTMASMVESLGIGMPGNAAWPAVDARRNVLARMAGRRIVELVRQKVTMSTILTRQAFENAIRANAAIGGSTNAVIHLIAIARRLGVDLTLDDWDRLGRGVHTLVNLMPNGRYLMEDFCYAGGLPAVLRELGENRRLHKSAPTVNGKAIWDNVRDAPCHNRDVITPFRKPFKRNTGIAVLRGNLAPRGAVIIAHGRIVYDGSLSGIGLTSQTSIAVSTVESAQSALDRADAGGDAKTSLTSAQVLLEKVLPAYLSIAGDGAP